MLLALTVPWWVLTFVLCFSIGIGAWLVFLWGVRTGQFRDAEKTAEDMMRLEQRETALGPAETLDERRRRGT